MTALAKRLVVFLLITAGLYGALMFALVRLTYSGRSVVFLTGDYYNWPGGETWQSFHDFSPDSAYDALIIGSSHAYRGYDPAVFGERGHRVFNLGTSGQSPLNTHPLVRRFIHAHNAPLLLFDIYEGTLQGDGFESTADLVQNQPSDAVALGLVRGQGDLRGLNMLALRLMARYKEPYYRSGWYRGAGFAPQVDSVGTQAGRPGPPKAFEPVQLERLAAIINLCQERGIRLVLTSHYARGNMRGVYHRPLVQHLDSLLAGTDIPYLDFTEVPGIDERNWFADHNHLNITGAKIFTGQLVDSLEALGYLPVR